MLYRAVVRYLWNTTTIFGHPPPASGSGHLWCAVLLQPLVFTSGQTSTEPRTSGRKNMSMTVRGSGVYSKSCIFIFFIFLLRQLAGFLECSFFFCMYVFIFLTIVTLFSIWSDICPLDRLVFMLCHGVKGIS